MSRIALLQAALSLAQSMLDHAVQHQWSLLFNEELEERKICNEIRSLSGKLPKPSVAEIEIARQILALHQEILAIAEPTHEDLGVLLRAWQLIESRDG